MFTGSLCEYKNRGNYGSNQYRGNTAGGIVRDFLEFAHKNRGGLFADPMQGGGTSGDVAAAMGIRYKGLDLKTGFNILQDDLGAALGEAAETIFCHPPYWNMIQYSNRQADLSNGTLEEFLQKLQLALMNVYDALRPGGMYGVLMGNYRRQGEYYPLCSLTRAISPGKLREEIVKIQNNCASDFRTYAGAGKSFIPIRHEMLYILQKNVTALLNLAIDFSERLQRVTENTWSNVVVRIFQQAQRSLSLDEIYEMVAGTATEKILKNKHWKAKVRQIVGQNYQRFERVSPGRYSLKTA